MDIELTEAAQTELKRIMGDEGASHRGVRIGVKGGGCSGFTYVMQFEDKKREFDNLVNEERVPVFIDAKSSLYLDGMQIDFAIDLLNRGFKFNNPNASKSCGCGTSFSV